MSVWLLSVLEVVRYVSKSVWLLGVLEVVQ